MGRVLTDSGDERSQPLDVVAWRYDQLIEAGYPVTEALLLADRPDIDLHDACELLVRGASVENAVQILT